MLNKKIKKTYPSQGNHKKDIYTTKYPYWSVFPICFRAVTLYRTEGALFEHAK